MLHAIAFIVARSGQREALIKELEAYIPQVKAQPGCHECVILVDSNEMGGPQAPMAADRFAIWQKWDNIDALRSHMASPVLRDFFIRHRDSIANRMLQVMSEVTP